MKLLDSSVIQFNELAAMAASVVNDNPDCDTDAQVSALYDQAIVNLLVVEVPRFKLDFDYEITEFVHALMLDFGGDKKAHVFFKPRKTMSNDHLLDLIEEAGLL
jgi:hypothetical protein